MGLTGQPLLMESITAACSLAKEPLEQAEKMVCVTASGTAPATSSSASGPTLKPCRPSAPVMPLCSSMALAASESSWAGTCKRTALCSEVIAFLRSPLDTLPSTSMAPGCSVTPSSAAAKNQLLSLQQGHEAAEPAGRHSRSQMWSMRSVICAWWMGLKRNLAQREARGSMMRET